MLWNYSSVLNGTRPGLACLAWVAWPQRSASTSLGRAARVRSSRCWFCGGLQGDAQSLSWAEQCLLCVWVLQKFLDPREEARARKAVEEQGFHAWEGSLAGRWIPDPTCPAGLGSHLPWGSIGSVPLPEKPHCQILIVFSGVVLFLVALLWKIQLILVGIGGKKKPFHKFMYVPIALSFIWFISQTLPGF